MADEFETNSKQEMKDSLLEFEVNIELHKEVFKAQMRMRKMIFDSYVEAGFTQKESLELLKAQIFAENSGAEDQKNNGGAQWP